MPNIHYSSISARISNICSCCLFVHIDFLLFFFYFFFHFSSISLSLPLLFTRMFHNGKKQRRKMKKRMLYRCIAYRGLKMFVLCQVWDDRIMCSFVMYWLSNSCDEIHTTLYLPSNFALNWDEQMHIYILRYLYNLNLIESHSQKCVLNKQHSCPFVFYI